MCKILFSLTFATALLAFASSEASAFVYSSFVCQAVGVRSVEWGRSFFVGCQDDCPESMRTSQRNLHHQLLRSGILITHSSRAGMPLRDQFGHFASDWLRNPITARC